jgi:hypothetical protein
VDAGRLAAGQDAGAAVGVAVRQRGVRQFRGQPGPLRLGQGPEGASGVVVQCPGGGQQREHAVGQARRQAAVHRGGDHLGPIPAAV